METEVEDILGGVYTEMEVEDFVMYNSMGMWRREGGDTEWSCWHVWGCGGSDVMECWAAPGDSVAASLEQLVSGEAACPMYKIFKFRGAICRFNLQQGLVWV